MLGWVRWPITVPTLTQAWTDPAASDSSREATAAAYDVLNGYAGAALGEHLGWLLQGIWAVGIAVLLLRTRRVPRWFAGLGLLGPQRLLGVVPVAPRARRAARASLAPAAGQADRGGDDSAALSRASSTLQ